MCERIDQDASWLLNSNIMHETILYNLISFILSSIFVHGTLYHSDLTSQKSFVDNNKKEMQSIIKK